MNIDLPSHFLRITQEAAVASARTLGYGDKRHSDHVAVEAMRAAMDKVPMRGRIVIGEGERDEAPMLYIGEPVGVGAVGDREIDIAVDPLEGTNLCATGAPNSIAVLAAAPKGGLLHAPDVYLEKLVVGPRCRGSIHLEATVEENLRAIARCLSRQVSDLLVVVLDRPRHATLVQELRAAGARIQLISDGDLAPAIAAAVEGTGVHAVMGAGGAPEGVLTAAALRCLGGEIQGRLKPAQPGDEERLRAAGFHDPAHIFHTEELAPGDEILFCATGVSNGSLLRGVTFFGHGHRTHSLLMTSRGPREIRFVDAIHVGDDYRGSLRLS
ncbi:MAG: class II fructose-bisphosphatase [Planctomycetaceae bacterium]